MELEEMKEKENKTYKQIEQSEEIEEQEEETKISFEIKKEEEEEEIENPLPNSKSKKILRIIITIFLLIFWISVLTISQKIWQVGLKECPYSMIQCFTWLSDEAFFILKGVLWYTLIHIYVFTHAFLLKKSGYRMLRLFGMITSLSSVFIRYLFSNGYEVKDHSAANMILCLAFLLIYALIFLFIFFTVKIFRGKSKKTKITWSVFWVLFALYISFGLIGRSCGNLDYTIGGFQVEKGRFCQFKRAKICWHNVADKFTKPLTWFGNNCKTRRMDDEQHKKM